MRLVLHVGMGKNGSSSIQHALRLSRAQLADQKAEYLGMWFDMINPTYRGFIEQLQFWSLPEQDRRQAGDRLAAFLKRRNEDGGAETFILSNEAWSGQAKALRPVIEQLEKAGIAVIVIAFVRDPAAWLPSAHVQWGVRNKLNKGSILSYEESARTLVNWYRGVIEWAEAVPAGFKALSYERSGDVVQAFAEAAGIEIKSPDGRLLERGEEAEILMRALFNRRFEGMELPDTFNRAMFEASSDIPSLEAMATKCFDYSATDAVISENSALFDEMANRVGFDVRGAGKGTPAKPDMVAVRERLFDYLIEMAFKQGMRIKSLEDRLEKMTQG